jgi:hypothetical protein
MSLSSCCAACEYYYLKSVHKGKSRATQTNLSQPQIGAMRPVNERSATLAADAASALNPPRWKYSTSATISAHSPSVLRDFPAPGNAVHCGLDTSVARTAHLSRPCCSDSRRTRLWHSLPVFLHRAGKKSLQTYVTLKRKSQAFPNIISRWTPWARTSLRCKFLPLRFAP